MSNLCQDVIDLQKWWMGELQKITQKLMEQEEKRKNRIRSKTEKMLADYTSAGQIQDAYGFGCITERQYDRLMDAWNKREVTRDKQYEMRMALVSEYYQIAKQIVIDNHGEV